MLKQVCSKQKPDEQHDDRKQLEVMQTGPLSSMNNKRHIKEEEFSTKKVPNM